MGSNSVLLIYCSSLKAFTKYFLIAAEKSLPGEPRDARWHLVIALEVKKYILNADLASVVYMSKHNFAPFKRMSLL